MLGEAPVGDRLGEVALGEADLPRLVWLGGFRHGRLLPWAGLGSAANLLDAPKAPARLAVEADACIGSYFPAAFSSRTVITAESAEPLAPSPPIR